MNFASIFNLERELAAYTGAPFVVLTDGCTHALELVFRYYQIQQVQFTAFTYVGIVQMLRNIKIDYQLLDEQWEGEYCFHSTNIWDSARRLEPGMYRSGQVQCLSFGNGKPIQVGKCGAVLLDDEAAYRALSCMRSDGRDLHISPWNDQIEFHPGWHYCPTLESAELARAKLKTVIPQRQKVVYPDCRKILFIL